MYTKNANGQSLGVEAGYVDGVLMRIAPAKPFYYLDIERAVMSSSAYLLTPSASAYTLLTTLPPETLNMAGTVFFDQVPHNVYARYWYRMRHTFPGYSSSAYIGQTLPQASQTYNTATINEFWQSQASFAAHTYDADGTEMQPDVGQNDGVTTLSLTKGTQQGVGQHADAISFGRVFQNIPFTVLQGGLSYQPESVWGSYAAATAGTATGAPSASLAQRDMYIPENLTVTGFNIRAVLYQLGSGTPVTDTFSGLTSTLSSFATDGNYQVNFHGRVTGLTKYSGPWGATMTVAVDSDNGSGWTERGTQVLEWELVGPSFDETIYGSVSFNDSLLDPGEQIRVRIKSMYWVGLFISTTETLTGDSVQYTAAASTQYANKTPDASTFVQWSSYGYI